MTPIVLAAIAGVALFVVSAIIHGVVRSAGDNPARDGIGWAFLAVLVSNVVAALIYAAFNALGDDVVDVMEGFVGRFPPFMLLYVLLGVAVFSLPFVSLATGLRLVYRLPRAQCLLFGFGIPLGTGAIGGLLWYVGSMVIALSATNPKGAVGVVAAIVAVVAASVLMRRRSAARFAVLAESDGD